jgi:hypothetical protein
MSNYIGYIDSTSIELADLAFEIGDYKCALENYNRALERLNRYQGDRMQPIMMAGSLRKRIEETRTKLRFGRSILEYDIWKLTKSSFVKGNQCVKSLYLDKHKRKEKNPITPEKQATFNYGNSFEDEVRRLAFPGGVNVKKKLTNYKYFNSYTKYLIQQTNTEIIYEASIIEDLVLVMCDILVKRKDGKIDVYEIKMNTEINEAIKADLAVQYTICKKRFGDKLNSFNLILRVNNENQPFQIIDLTAELSNKIEQVELQISEFKKVLDLQEPTISMGDYCLSPYECDFTNYCRMKKEI